jgi:hypothetical protein
MASGFIYLIILGMWAAYFLPRWISSHDQNSGKSHERYKSALKVVAENGSQPLAFEISAVEESFDLKKKDNQIARRRIIFTSLVSILLISSVGSFFGFIDPAILLIPASAMSIYVVHVRRQVVASQARARKLKALEQISHADISPSQERISFTRQTHTTIFGEIAATNSSLHNEHWIPLAERTESTGVVIIPRGSAAMSKAWEPRQVPAPTYVTAPKAVPSKRIIDLTIPGAWSAAQERERQELLPNRDDIFDQELADEAANNSGRAANE